MSESRGVQKNRLLASLSAGDLALLQPHLESVELPVRRQLEQRHRPVSFVYFLDSGLASVIASAGSDLSIEVGIIGNEGMTGLSVLLDTELPAYETFIQSAGFGRRIPTPDFQSAIGKSDTLKTTMLRYVSVLITQMGFTALANGRYKLEERLARWLLMAQDRADGPTLYLTHEFLALMLGCRRAGVTITLQDFQQRGYIETQRSVIQIKNRTALEDAANGSYGAPEAQYARLFNAV